MVDFTFQYIYFSFLYYYFNKKKVTNYQGWSKAMVKSILNLLLQAPERIGRPRLSSQHVKCNNDAQKKRSGWNFKQS